MNKEHGEAVSERVAELLANRILSGKLAPGVRIKQDELAAELNISRIPVRDALRILAARGLVAMRANAGAKVIALDAHDLAAAFAIRERLEPLLLEDSLAHYSYGDVIDLRALLDAGVAGDEPDAVLHHVRGFLTLACRRHASSLLAAMVGRVWDATQSYALAAWLTLDTQQALAASRTCRTEMEMIFEAIWRGDIASARAALVLHIRRVRAAVVGDQLPEWRKGAT